MRFRIVLGALCGAIVATGPVTAAWAAGGATAGVRPEPSVAGGAHHVAPRSEPTSHRAAARLLRRRPLSPDTPSLSANPSTNLLDGQVITVTGAGFAADAPIGIVECQSGAVSEADCDLGTLESATTGSTGSFSSSYTAIRVIDVGGTIIDCAQGAGCLLGAADEDDVSQAAATPILFKDVAIIPPALAVVPATNLRDGQRVTVTGAHFTPNASITITECQAGPTTPVCDPSVAVPVTADPSGGFSVRYVAVRIIHPEGSALDCAQVGACVLAAVNEREPTQQVSTAIAFADVALKKPRVRVTPHRQLVDGQLVTVSARNLGALTNVAVFECSAVSPTDCANDTVAQATADAHGRATLTYDVARVVPLFDGTVDCAASPGCVLSVFNADFPGVPLATAPLSFDPQVPPLPGLRLKMHLRGVARVDTSTGAVTLTGSAACNRSSPVPVSIDLQVTEQLAPAPANGFFSAVVSCARVAQPWSATVTSLSTPFNIGSGAATVDAFARSGSSFAEQEINVPITLEAPGPRG